MTASDATVWVAALTFAGLLVQAVFNYAGAERARRHEIEKMRLEFELKEREEAE